MDDRGYTKIVWTYVIMIRMKLCLLVFIATIDGDYKAMSVLRHQGACIPVYLLPGNNINVYKAGFIDVNTYL